MVNSMSKDEKDTIKKENNYNDQTDLSSNNNKKKFSCSINGCEYKTDHKGHFDTHLKRMHIRDPKDLLHCTQDGCTYHTFKSNHLNRHRKTVHIRDPKDLLHCTQDGCTYQTFQK